MEDVTQWTHPSVIDVRGVVVDHRGQIASGVMLTLAVISVVVLTIIYRSALPPSLSFSLSLTLSVISSIRPIPTSSHRPSSHCLAGRTDEAGALIQRLFERRSLDKIR